MKTKLRMTLQTKAVINTINNQGHASNAQILKVVRKQFPNLSATTVHRITTRLINYNILAEGPKVKGVILVDCNTEPHDHFMCSSCGGVMDISINDKIREEIKTQTGIKLLSSSMVITGDCKNCN